jgi:hypothetical protein
LNKRFNLDFRIQPVDGVDIYQAGSMEEIYRFLAKPPAFCHYCKMDSENMTWFDSWRQSTRDVHEWVDGV